MVFLYYLYCLKTQELKSIMVNMKKFILKYLPIIIGIIIGLMFGDRLFGGFFYDLGTKFGEWLGDLIF